MVPTWTDNKNRKLSILYDQIRENLPKHLLAIS